jgi:hypothetical protein
VSDWLVAFHLVRFLLSSFFSVVLLHLVFGEDGHRGGQNTRQRQTAESLFHIFSSNEFLNMRAG